MFTFESHSNFKQSATFVVSLGLQSAALAILCSLSYTQMSGPSIRHTSVAAARTITPIYFQKEAPAPEPEPAPQTSHTIVKPPAPKPVEQAATSEVADESANGSSPDGDTNAETNEGIVPFPAWRMNAAPTTVSMFHHTMKSAIPVFTPDPPILHGKFPEEARGREVVLEVVINDEGTIVMAHVLQGIGYGVEQQIVETLRRWIFVPAKVNDRAIPSRRQLHFQFPS